MRAALVLLLGLALLASLGLAAERTAAPAVESRLVEIVADQLREAGLPTELVVLDGRDAHVDAGPGQAAIQSRIIEVLATIPGLRAIHSRPVEPGTPPRLEAHWRESTLTVTGSLQGSGTEEERLTLSDILRRTLGNATVVNEIAVEPGVDRAQWVGEIPGLFRIVWGNVPDGELSIEGPVLTVSGLVADENVRTELGERLSALLPGMTVRNRISVPGGHDEVRAGIDAILATGPIEFREGTDRLTEESQDVMDRMAELLIAHADVVVRIEGYLYTGRVEEALPLSRVRANAVRDYLLGRGVLPSRLVARGMGSPDGVAGVENQDVESLIRFLVQGGV